MFPKITHEDEKGFIKGRYTGENIRLLYNVLVYTEKEYQIPVYSLILTLRRLLVAFHGHLSKGHLI